MGFKISPATIELLQQQPPDDDSPWENDGGTTYLRHNALRITQKAPERVEIDLLWNGKVTATMRADCTFAAGQQLTLSGIEGRMMTFTRPESPAHGGLDGLGP